MRRFLVLLLLVLALLCVPVAYFEFIVPASPPAGDADRSSSGHGHKRHRHPAARARGCPQPIRLRFLARGAPRHIESGRIRVAQPAALPAIYDRIVRGDVYTRAVTVPEGFNLSTLPRRSRMPNWDRRRLLAAANQDVALIADLGSGSKEPRRLPVSPHLRFTGR